jgi:hypothetical protein
MSASPDPAPAPAKEAAQAPAQPKRANPLEAALPWFTAGLAVLGGGFYWGYAFKAQERPTLEQLQERERQELTVLGWKPAAEGVLTRWCTQDCAPPKLYGGGKAQVLEVYCKDRPCGTIHVTFKVLNRQGRVIGTTSAEREGLQGELLRLRAISADPAADHFEVESFTAQAVVS